MCGIAGLVGASGVEERDVENMIRTIRYRGVDEADTKTVGRALLGHARLAVVDLENGKQPMSNTDDTVWVTFNGEIYNYVELRQELKAKGYRFKSRCDTEVLVHLWREEGERMLSRLVGMFTFFIWDTRYDRGMLARDRQGIKPCFIADYEGGTAFCSEIKGILGLPGFDRQIDDEALKQVFCFNYPLPPATCFKGVTHLEPGCYLLFEGSGRPVKKRYWQWPLLEDRQALQQDDFARLIDDALTMQMRFDVDGGLYLSGGVDSSVVASHLVKHWNREVIDAVGLNFSEAAYSEYEYSRQVASLLGISLNEAVIDSSMVPDIAADVSYHAEQPHGDFSFFLFYILARGAHRENKIVMFSGDGPDEFMAGFTHNEAFFADRRGAFDTAEYFDRICYMSAPMRERLLLPEFERSTRDPLHSFDDCLQPWRSLPAVEQVMAYECTVLMPGNNLVKSDRMGAAWSIEGRSPFLDHRVTEALTRLPADSKFAGGVGKRYLKDFALRSFDRDLIFKKKTMPTTPIGEWIKGDLYGWAKDLLKNGEGYCINTDAAVRLLDEHRRGEGNYTRELRTLLMTKLWLRTFFDESRVPDGAERAA